MSRSFFMDSIIKSKTKSGGHDDGGGPAADMNAIFLKAPSQSHSQRHSAVSSSVSATASPQLQLQNSGSPYHHHHNFVNPLTFFGPPHLQSAQLTSELLDSGLLCPSSMASSP